MSFGSGYRGSVGGFVQNNYTDQPGVGVPGMLAFASDFNFTDSVSIGEPDGIAAGIGVVFQYVDDKTSLQRPHVAAYLPTDTTVASDFKGVVVFAEDMQSNEYGIPGVENGRIGSVLLNSRSGGRIYVRTFGAIDPATDDVYLRIIESATEPLGSFSSVASAETIIIPNAKWVTAVVIDSNLGMIELLG